MPSMMRAVQELWVLGLLGQMIVCGFLFFRGHYRKLPFFTAYIVLNICQAGFLYALYVHFGFGSHGARMLAWWSEAGTLILRSLATAEVLRVVLSPYRGIWGLGWRVLCVAFGLVLSFAALEAGSNLDWAFVLADRGFHLAFAVALVACLLLVRHYSIPVHSAYKALLGGFCFHSCTVVLANTIGQTLFPRESAHYQPIWQAVTTGTYAVVQVVWAVALRKPLPAEEKQQARLPASIYQQISPEINQRLRSLNDQLSKFWEPEVSRR